MHYGVLEHQRLKSELFCEKRDYFDASRDAVDVRQWNLIGSLQAMDGQITNLHLQTHRDGVVGPQLHPAACFALESFYDAGSHVSLK